MSETEQSQAITTYGKIDQSCIAAIEFAVDKIEKCHTLNNGKTALFWHLVDVINRHIDSHK